MAFKVEAKLHTYMSNDRHPTVYHVRYEFNFYPSIIELFTLNKFAVILKVLEFYKIRQFYRNVFKISLKKL